MCMYTDTHILLYYGTVCFWLWNNQRATDDFAPTVALDNITLQTCLLDTINRSYTWGKYTTMVRSVAIKYGTKMLIKPYNIFRVRKTRSLSWYGVICGQRESILLCTYFPFSSSKSGDHHFVVTNFPSRGQRLNISLIEFRKVTESCEFI